MDKTLTLPLKNSSRSVLPAALFVIAMAAIGLVAGAIVGLGSMLLNVLLIGGLLGTFLLAVPAVHTMWILLLLVFMIVGQVSYFGGLGRIIWVPYGIGLLLYFKLTAAMLGGGVQQDRTGTPLMWPVLLFIAAVFLSIAINMPHPLPTVAGGKNYLALWSIFFLIAMGAIPIASLDRMWRFFFVIAAFQVPLVAYQYIVVAPSRVVFGGTIGAPWDSIVGGFGGDPMGGGASGSMALFLSIIMVLGAALYRRKLLGTGALLLILAAALTCVGLAEVKIIAVFIPIGLVLLLAGGARRSLGLIVIAIPLAIIAVFGIFYVYMNLHYEESRSAATDPLELTQKTFANTLDPNLINYATGEMGRAAALKHWWNENVGVDPVRAFVGHGPGASRNARIFGSGEAAKKYPFQVNRSAAAQLLWDVGVLGFLLFVVVLIRGALLAFTAARAPDCPLPRAAALEATSAGLIMMVAMLPYSREVLEVPAVGVLMMFLLGYAVLCTKLRKPQGRGRGFGYEAAPAARQ